MPINQNYNYCLNCKTQFPKGFNEKEEIFCSHCGQSSKERRLSIFKLLKDGISNVLNLDSGLIHTFRDIIYPAKLTRTYIEGKRKYYVNPARLFVFMLIGIISVSLWLAKLDNTSFEGDLDLIQSRAEKSAMLVKYDNLVDSLDLENKDPISDTIRARLFKNVYKPENDTIGLSNGITFFGVKKDIRKYGISSYDAVHLPIDDIFTKYEITDFLDKQYASTFIRVSTNPADSLIYILKNLTWTVFITLILLSIFMKLIYIREHYYIVEHAVLQLNLHSFYFVAISAVIIVDTFINSVLPKYEGNIEPSIYAIIFLFVGGVQFFAIKKYYNHGVFRALLSQFLINFAYFFFFFLSVIFVTLISVFLY
ncbi:MAG: hypothetical protein ACI86M_000792 [Saprospiraceae bacterium]|jgi:hypothetical protein